MNPRKKNEQSLHPTKSNPRWAWMAGATAITAAATSASHAAEVQINLINDYVNSLSGVHLNCDLTGRGTPLFSVNAYGGVGANRPEAYIATHQLLGIAVHHPYGYFIDVLGVAGSSPTPHSGIGLLSLTFTDPKFNGGAVTNADLEILAFNTSATDETVEFTRLVFDDSDPSSSLSDLVAGGSDPVIGSTDNGVYTPAPEPSGLALLALGAGGILARRQRRQAA